MRNFAIAIVLSIFSTGVFACCDDISFNIDRAKAGAIGGGYGYNIAKATSSTSGNGSAVNNAFSGSSVGVTGYARAGQLRGLNGDAGGRLNGYQAGVEVETGTYAVTYSNNQGDAYGGAYADATARGIGAAGGIATSKTLNLEGCWWLDEEGSPLNGMAVAGSAAGGIVAASSDATSKTYGPGESSALTASGAIAGVDVEGVADTDSDEFRASASDDKYALTASVSELDGNGFTYGGADAWAVGGVLAGGFVWNKDVDIDINDRLPQVGAGGF